MVNLTGHEAGNGGYSQGTPKAHRAFLYSEHDGALTDRELSVSDSAIASRAQTLREPKGTA